MGFQSGHIEKGMVDLRRDLPILSIDEINFLLYFIGESSFKGKDMRQVYALSLKLNNILQHQLKINEKESLNKNQ